VSYQNKYYYQNEKEIEAAGELEEARLHNLKNRLDERKQQAASFLEEVQLDSLTNSLNEPQSNKSRRFYRTTTFSVVLTASLSIATIASGYFAYQKFPVVRETVQNFIDSFKLDYSQRSAQTLVSRANALRAKELYKESEFTYQAAVEKFALKENIPGLGNVYTELGILHTRTRDYKAAEQHFQKAISYFGKGKDTDGLGYANINLGQLHFIQNHFKLAEKHFLEANQHYMISGNGNGLGNVALGLGNLYMATRDWEKSFQYLKNAETVFNIAKNDRGLINTYNSMSRSLRAMAKKAIQFDKEALSGEVKEFMQAADKLYQISKSIELDTQTRDLPSFSIQESFPWLMSAFNENRDVYESELNAKAKEQTERALK